jgi:hypothetical protein
VRAPSAVRPCRPGSLRRGGSCAGRGGAAARRRRRGRGCPARSRRRAERRAQIGPVRRLRPRPREAEDDGRTLAQARLDRELAPVRLGEAAGDRETEPGPGRLAGRPRAGTARRSAGARRGARRGRGRRPGSRPPPRSVRPGCERAPRPARTSAHFRSGSRARAGPGGRRPRPRAIRREARPRARDRSRTWRRRLSPTA